jgi:hypothetical protein
MHTNSKQPFPKEYNIFSVHFRTKSKNVKIVIPKLHIHYMPTQNSLIAIPN